MADVLDVADGVGGELVLRRDGDELEVIENGMFLMDTRNGASERLLVTGAADLLAPGARLLIGGLGVGFSLRAALDHPSVGSVVVVEREAAVITWNRTGPLSAVHGSALDDPRAEVVEADLVPWLATTTGTFDALCLDIDNGPEWTVTPGNTALYAESGVDALARLLRPGGVLAVWSAAAAPAFTDRLRARFTDVRVAEVPVPRGEPDVVWFARGVTSPSRRPSRPS